MTTTFLTITMTDSVGDGWGGNIFGIMQEDTVVGTFGNTITYGSKTDPVYIPVESNKFAQIYVKQLG